jgi:phosphoribosylamine--glycine ligase
MERVGIFVVSYGSREAAIVDALSRSEEYDVNLYIVDRQRNPFNIKRSTEHTVIKDLDPERIANFVEKRKDEIDFGIVGPEKPIILGVRDLIEEKCGIPVICPRKDYAIEGSKVNQREILQKLVPEVNPRFRVFKPEDYSDERDVKRDLYEWLDELENEVAVKPDAPAAGKGVGVWGDHFSTREEVWEHFLSCFREGAVIVEEKIEGEESSFQAFCDGKNLVPLPDTRDYKRAFDEDRGPNTGGMGSYKSKEDYLPFLSELDYEKEVEIAKKIFKGMKKEERDEGLLGVPFYLAFMHTSKGPMILEINSRPGDPEIMNILPLLKEDFVELCFRILEGNLNRISIEKRASVVTYKVPPSYGGFSETFPEKVRKDEIGTPIDLSSVEKLREKYGDNIRIYPGSMEMREDGKFYALSSRTVAVVGISEEIQDAREISIEGIKAIKGGALWYRSDIASREHIKRSIEHMKRLRSQ